MIFELLGCLILISLASLIGALFIGLNSKKIEEWLEFMVAFAIGALLGEVFIHLLPELAENGFSVITSMTILIGILTFFVLEKFIHWHHCHHTHHRHDFNRFTYTSIAADAIHNIIDGIILAGAFLASPVLGFSTAIAIVLHEIPQEIGDFSILLKGGFSKKKALAFNFLVSLTSFVGALLAVAFSYAIAGATPYLIAFAAGSFLYIAGTDLFPELHKEYSTKKAIMQLFFLILGMVIMASLLLLE